jgi:hypothetical protein
MITLRKLTRDDVVINVFAIADDLEVEGNASVSGDDNYDRLIEEEINLRLWAGDVWAWANVEVRVSWRHLEGSDYLGACSYKNEQDFIENSCYYDEMVNSALADLNGQIQGMYNHIVTLLEVAAE